MAKLKTRYVCQNCGVESSKWIGRCPSCNEWNTYVEEVIEHKKSIPGNQLKLSDAKHPVTLEEIETDNISRTDTKNAELNRLLGGGMVPGSVILLGGEPGIGKSTIALQLALTIDKKVLYISGEESLQQLKLRAERIAFSNSQLKLFNENALEIILHVMVEETPELVIIDSIQTMTTSEIESSQGSISQVRECAWQLTKYAKMNKIPLVIIGHINKEGNLAGPKVLEHVVDVVLNFEGDSNYQYRIIRALKNRFGSVDELGIFEMTSRGLIEVSNPSEILISSSNNNLSGIAIAAAVNGNRSFLIEIQSLVSSAVYNTPQRSSTGIDYRRLNMLLAVLENRSGFKLAVKDVFLNIAGGIQIKETGIDLAVVCAIMSSAVKTSIPGTFCFAAEVGLTGEVRAVTRVEQRIAEAERLGYSHMFLSQFHKGKIKQNSKITLEFASTVNDVFKKLFK